MPVPFETLLPYGIMIIVRTIPGEIAPQENPRWLTACN